MTHLGGKRKYRKVDLDGTNCLFALRMNVSFNTVPAAASGYRGVSG